MKTTWTLEGKRAGDANLHLEAISKAGGVIWILSPQKFMSTQKLRMRPYLE